MSLPNKIPGVVNYSELKGSVELREIELPQIGGNDVLLQVENVGVCGSDLHQWTSDHSWKVNYPVVLGHEFGGIIVELGENVNGWKIGDRVVSETAAVIDSQNPMYLMSCLPCLERRVLNIWNLCRLIHGTGFISMMDLSLITAHH